MHIRPTELCQLATVWNGIVPDGGIMAECKIDGFRGLYYRDHTGRPALWTRRGMPIEGAAHIIHRLALIEEAAGMLLMIDGEYQVDGTLAATKLWCESGWRQGGNAGLYHAFDCLPYADWQNGGGDTPLFKRKAWLSELAAQVDTDAAAAWDWRPGSRGADGDASPVLVMPDEWAADTRDVVQMVQRIWNAGGEGMMLKDACSPYQRKRSDAWLKVKQNAAWQRKLAA